MSEKIKEGWLQRVAMTTTILAVAGAISSLRASSYSAKVQIQTTREANHMAWIIPCHADVHKCGGDCTRSQCCGGHSLPLLSAVNPGPDVSPLIP